MGESLFSAGSRFVARPDNAGKFNVGTPFVLAFACKGLVEHLPKPLRQILRRGRNLYRLAASFYFYNPRKRVGMSTGLNLERFLQLTQVHEDGHASDGVLGE